MSHIHYLFVSLILFLDAYMLDLLLLNLSIANGAIGGGIFNFLYSISIVVK